MQTRIARLAAAYGAALALAATGGCLSIPTEGQNDLFVEYRFTTEEPEWLMDFVDFPASQEAEVAFVGEYRPLPAGPATSGLAAYLSGNNISDDLFMFWKRPLTGLLPNGLYDVTITVEFVTNYGQDCQVGNAVSVWIKAGLVPGEPSRELDSDNNYRLNVDKGQQANGSDNVLVLGDIRNGQPGCTGSVPFAGNRYTSARHALRVQASEDGGFWVLFGTESGFESPHEIYFTRLRFDLRPVF